MPLPETETRTIISALVSSAAGPRKMTRVTALAKRATSAVTSLANRAASRSPGLLAAGLMAMTTELAALGLCQSATPPIVRAAHPSRIAGLSKRRRGGGFWVRDCSVAVVGSSAEGASPIRRRYPTFDIVSISRPGSPVSARSRRRREMTRFTASSPTILRPQQRAIRSSRDTGCPSASASMTRTCMTRGSVTMVRRSHVVRRRKAGST